MENLTGQNTTASLRFSLPATEYGWHRGGLVSAVGDHNIERVSCQGLCNQQRDAQISRLWDYFDELLEADMRKTRFRGAFLSQTARHFCPEWRLHTLLQVSSVPTDFVRLLRAIRVESKQISQLGKSLLDPFNWVVRTPEFYDCNWIEIY